MQICILNFLLHSNCFYFAYHTVIPGTQSNIAFTYVFCNESAFHFYNTVLSFRDRPNGIRMTALYA